MRYTDEGNIRFVGNTRTSTSTQGVYRQEFDSGKWAVTLTNTEPGLGYLGYNVEALSYDFENNMLCTSNISASCINVSDTIVTHCLESCCGLSFECGCISNGPSEIRLYGRPDCSGPDDGCLVVADNWLCYCTRNCCSSIVLDSTGVWFKGPNIGADELIYTTDNHTLCTYNLQIRGELCGDLTGDLTVSSSINASGDLYVSGAICGDGEVHLNDALYLGDVGDVCIYDRDGRDVFCSYQGELCIYGWQFSNGSYTSDKSYIEIENDAIQIGHETRDGAFGISLCSSDDCITFRSQPASEKITFHNGNTISTSSSCLKLDNDVCVPDIFTIGSGSSTKCHYIHTVSLNSVSYTSDDGTIDLGNITATVDLNNTNSLFITNCTFSNPPLSSIVIGHNACAAVDSRPGYYATSYSVAIGDSAEVCGINNVAIGCKACAVGSSTAIGTSAKACNMGTSIGHSTCSCNNALALGAYAHASCKNVAIGFRAIVDCTCFNYITTKTESCIYTGSSYKDAGFGSTQILIKNNTLECDLYNVLKSIIACNVRAGTSYNKNLLLLDKAIYRDVNDLSILGSGDYNTSITYASDYISIGNRMTVHNTCESAISLKCANSYEVWNILF